MESLRQAMEQVSSTSRRLMTRMFKGSKSAKKGSKEGKNCCICLSQISKMARLSPCGHEFDLGCIEQWLTKSTTCPYCRRRCSQLEFNMKRNRTYRSSRKVLAPEVVIDYTFHQLAEMTGRPSGHPLHYGRHRRQEMELLTYDDVSFTILVSRTRTGTDRSRLRVLF
ncbi:E3 ubiquitin-protein ligase ATL42 [Halotydeus destructor]|nr:E3 ubiquitin-protein ligase ATL42 [Halotydeus destructor]